MVRLLQRLHRPRRRPKQHARGQNEPPRVVDEESLGTGIEKAREKVVKLPKIITCTKGGGKCGDASGALCTQRGCKRSADARARGRCAAASALCRGGDGTHGCKPWMCDTRRCAACHALGMLGLTGCAGKGVAPEFAWMVALVDAVSTTACCPRAASCRSQARREDCEKPDPTGMISSTFQPWPILSSSGPPLTCHVPDLFSRASEFLHGYCVRWGLGGSHGVAPA